MSVQVDEPRRHVQPAGIDDLSGLGSLQVSYGGDYAAFDAKVGFVPGVTRPVENHAVFDHDVELRHVASSINVL
jgi:hypothetical protein